MLYECQGRGQGAKDSALIACLFESADLQYMRVIGFWDAVSVKYAASIALSSGAQHGIICPPSSSLSLIMISLLVQNHCQFM